MQRKEELERILERIDGKEIEEFCLRLQTRPKKRVGHWDVDLHLLDEERKESLRPIITGLLSSGNMRQGVGPWLDIHYLDRADFAGRSSVILSQAKGFAESLFRMVGDAIPAGGMIFLSYLTDRVWGFDSRLHEFTRCAVSVSSLKIPAVALPLGRLLFFGGCQNIKGDVYDVQGSGRLAGEKAPTPEYEKIFLNKMVLQLKEYMSREPSVSFKTIDETCRSNANEVLVEAKRLLQDK